MANPKDVIHSGYLEEKLSGHAWFTCEHEWEWHPDSSSGHEVYCRKCGVVGEVQAPNYYDPGDIERDGVFWPAT